MWMLYTLLYGLLKGGREIVKKKSMEKSSVMEVLFFYTLLAFLFVVPTAPKVGGVCGRDMILIALKSFVIFVAWLMSFRAIKQIPVSFYGVIDLSRVLFSMLLAFVFLNERLGMIGIFGLILVSVGMIFCNTTIQKKGEKVKTKLIIFALCSSFLNAVSGTMDKVLTKTVNSTQLQFWYMLFLVLYYIIYIIVTKEKIHFKSMIKNYWIWILAIMFVIGDKAIFLANMEAGSQVMIMTLIKQSCCLVSIIGGRIVFKEKNIRYKIIGMVIVVSGILLATLGKELGGM